MRFDMITVGEAMALFIAQTPGPLERVPDFRRSAAGAELNVAIGLARLGFKVGYLSRVGRDAFGRFLLDTLDREGIDRTHVSIDPLHSTGFMLKSMTDGGRDAEIDYYRRDSAAGHLGTADLPQGFCASARHLHLTGICAALSDSTRELVLQMVREARSGGCTVSFDPNLRPRLWPSEQAMVRCLNDLAAQCDLVLPGLAEGRLLTGRDKPADIVRFYIDRGVRQVVVKLGAAGACFAQDDAAQPPTYVPGVPVDRVVDTVGAGDGFATGVISALLDGLALGDAVARGNAIGALVVQSTGDSDGLPDRAALERAYRPATDHRPTASE